MTHQTPAYPTLTQAVVTEKTCGCGPDCNCGDACACGSNGKCAPACACG